jgi:hypothetical protein
MLFTYGIVDLMGTRYHTGSDIATSFYQWVYIGAGIWNSTH